MQFKEDISMPPKPLTDEHIKMLIENQERITGVEKSAALDHERIGVLEKQASNMAQMPATVAALGQKVESMNTSFIREVDGLREQSKAHQIQTEQKMEKGLKDIVEKVEGIGGKVSAIVLQDAKQSATQRGWWQVLQAIGSILVGSALILETYKALTH
jgi:hypothetical protein